MQRMGGAEYSNFDVAKGNCGPEWKDFSEFLHEQYHKGFIQPTTSWNEVNMLWTQTKFPNNGDPGSLKDEKSQSVPIKNNSDLGSLKDEKLQSVPIKTIHYSIGQRVQVRDNGKNGEMEL
eukprot:TRINITY_DN1356_c0_g1_i1.p2 TRINITY_DN1356_c0_g1~~TRINITY_DN1356_c0_g1_i1.p2  ORF type:complete len:120 (-),score=28.92 TRINITY_DN1356_c0_g1_i1:227-586(-)